MGFVSLPVNSGRRDTLGVTFSVCGRKKRQWRLVLGTDVRAALGWARGDRVAIEVGEGDDLGRLRLVKSPVGRTLTKMGAAATIGLSCNTFAPGWATELIRAVRCRHQADQKAGTVTVELPPGLTQAARVKAVQARPVVTKFAS
ncbi:MAG: hypothetical protein AB7F67_03970 [Rhodospirillaceae bacterium]